jgi:hypothetical protein
MKRTIIFMVIVMGLTGCYELYDVLDPYDPGEPDQIEYIVSGTCGISNIITIENSSGGTSQFSDVALPWSYEWEMYYSNDDFLYVSAQNGTDSGSIIVQILINGSVVETSTSSGAYVIATAYR